MNPGMWLPELVGKSPDGAPESVSSPMAPPHLGRVDPDDDHGLPATRLGLIH